MMEPTDVIAMFDRLDADRSTLKSLVQDVREYCLPGRATVTRKRTEGEDLSKELYDSTPERALQRFATGYYNYMWNPSRTNFILLPPEGDREGGDYSRPLLALSERLRDGMAQSNFEEAFYEDALESGSAGTSTMEVNAGVKEPFEFTSYPFEQVVFTENRAGRVDGVLRKFSWTARQIVQEFGEGEAKVGKSVSDAYAQPGGRGREKMFEIVHAAVPRTEFTVGRRDVRNMPIASLWALVADKIWLRQSGWPQQRYLVTRFAKCPGDKHGRSLGMTGLADCKMLQKAAMSLILAVENVVRPTILNPDTSYLSKQVLKPGTLLNYRVNQMNPNVKPEPFNTGARVDFGLEFLQAIQETVKTTFFNDLFLILSDPKQRTATEVRGILGEKLGMLGPAWGRQKVERFDPMIGIQLAILSQGGGLTGVPEEYLRRPNIRYISTLAVALQFAEMSLMQEAYLFLSPFAEIDPTIWDNFTFDEIARGIMEKMALPPRWLKPRDAVKALREGRMQFQMQQAQQAMALQQMQLMGKTGKRPEAGSPAEAMMAEAA